MGKYSNIAWTDHTWNTWVGCNKRSEGCDNCYMFREQKRFGNDPTELRRTKARTFNSPARWKDPAKIFVCSWSDFFHEDVPEQWRLDALQIMAKNHQHTYLILTKRPENIDLMMPIEFLEDNLNVWLGVTAENQVMADYRIPLLLKSKAETIFVSAEPLLEPINFWKFATREETFGSMYDHRGTYPMYQDIGIKKGSFKYHKGIDWIIVGGESGPNCRKMKPEWARDIQNQCLDAGVPFFMKQMSGNTKTKRESIPTDLQVQQFPGDDL